MEKSRYDNLKDRGLTMDSVFRNGEFESLKKILLSAGGCAVIFLNTVDHYEKLVKGGKFVRGDIATKVSGRPSDCHNNVEELVNKKKYLRHFYCFALSEDGVWRQHSVAIKDDHSYILETTVKRLLYFGIEI